MIQTTQKTPGWEARLDALIEEKAKIKFQWGVQDCRTFCHEAFIVMAGIDPMEGMDFKYQTKFGAYKMLHKRYRMGFLNTCIQIFDELGLEEVDDIKFGDILFARIGIEDPEESVRLGGVTMGIGYNDAGSIIVPGEKGLMLIDEYELVRGWRL